MAGRSSEFKCDLCGRVFRLKSSLDVHIPIHKSEGVFHDRSVDSNTDSTNFSQNQGNVLKFLEKGDPPLSCKHCGKHFTLHLCLKTHMIDCKQKSLSYSKAENFSTEKLQNFDVTTAVSNDENLVFINQVDCHSKDVEKAVNPSVASESMPLKFSSCLVKSAGLTSALKKNIEKKCTIASNKVKILKIPHKNVAKQIKRIERDPLDTATGDLMKKRIWRSKSKEKKQLESDKESLLCDMCGKCFSNKFKLSIHLKYHFSKFICQMCNKKFLSQHALSRHSMACSCSDEVKTCKYCSLKFSHKGCVSRHIRRVHLGKNKDTQCEFCGKMFDKTCYAVHRRTHTGERPYYCELCGASFVQSHHLQVHLTSHGERKYQCYICHKAFALKKSLDKHVMRCKLKGSKDENGRMILSNEPNNCSHCDKSFPSITLLNHHEKTHHDIVRNYKGMPHECSYCGKQFTFITHLKIHEMIHTGEKPFICSFCDKKFRLRCTLINHERTHTGERPFTCKECGKSFVQRAHLSTHLILHTGEKPYQCSYCGKAFANQSNLSAHKKLHLKK